MLRRVWNEIKSWYMRELVRDKGRLEDIVEYSSNVLKIIDGIDFEEFSSNILVYFATMKNVEIVGEAANSTFPIREKKAANRKGLAAHDRSVSYFFYGLYI